MIAIHSLSGNSRFVMFDDLLGLQIPSRRRKVDPNIFHMSLHVPYFHSFNPNRCISPHHSVS